ncbi:MAG: acyltransferase domain-containing protein, partial [Propionibacteriaceae bacterium]|nr:acyltransferase domain-containing protein [Propionibacteriaceae bacterium]
MTATNKPDDIAIVGISMFAPESSSPNAFWANLAEGADCITEAPDNVIESLYFGGTDSSQPDRFYNNRGGFAPRGFADPLRYGFLPVAAEGGDPDQFMSLMMAEAALSDAEVLQKGMSLNNACVIIGRGNFAGLPQLISSEVVRMAEELSWILRSALPELPESEIMKIKRDYQSRFGRYQGDTMTAAMPSLVSSGVAHHFDIHGPAYSLDAACASGLVAIQHGMRLLRTGASDIAVVGAMHTSHSAVFWSAFNLMGAMSKKGVSAPFSKDADGLLIGQGAGFLVLKTLERAEADGDRIYAVVKSVAIGSDGTGSNVLVTNPDGQRRVLEEAWANSGLDPEEVAYVEAHGTGTPVGDYNELQSLTSFFGDASHRLAYLGSVKSNIGHLMPAAGMVGLIKTVLSLYMRKIPPTLHCENPLTLMEKSRFEPVQSLVDWREAGLPLVAGVNAFGFGGVNGHAVLTAYEEAAEEAPRYRSLRRHQGWRDVFALAAPSKEAMLEIIDLSRFRNRIGSVLGSMDDQYRLVVFNPTIERIKLALDIVQRDQPWHGRSDIWFSNKPLIGNGGKVVFMFPGYSISGLSEHQSLEDELGLTFTDVQTDHPGAKEIADFFYTSMIVHEALLKTGVKPDIYTGHSVGEWHAARACGVLDESFDELAVVFDSDPAYQLDPSVVPDFKSVAVNSPLSPETVERLMAVPDTYLCNDNCPSQLIFTIFEYALPEFLAILDEVRASYRTLPFGVALHTSFISPLVDSLIELMDRVPVHDGTAPLWSAITLSEVLTTKRTSASEVFAAELVQTVRFRELTEKLYEEGARFFIQSGSGTLPNFID